MGNTIAKLIQFQLTPDFREHLLHRLGWQHAVGVITDDVSDTDQHCKFIAINIIYISYCQGYIV